MTKIARIAYEKFAGRERHKQHLFRQQNFYDPQNKGTPFPNSHGPENLDIRNAPNQYYEVLKEYAILKEKIDPQKADYPDGDPNTVHKLHINPPLVHVVETSNYLISKDSLQCSRHLKKNSHIYRNLMHMARDSEEFQY